MKRHITVLLVLGILPSAALYAQQTATTTFRVSATVNAVCEVTATDLSFGAYTSNTGTPLLGTTLLRATCTPNTSYNIGLNEGTSAGATVNARKMVAGAQVLTYQLYSDASRSVIWGNTTGTDTVTGTGTGVAVDHTVYGSVPAKQVVPAGEYSDVITVRVYYSEEMTMLRVVSLWAFLAFCCTAQAGGFAVVPLRAELGKNKTSSLTVTNGDEAKTFEVRAVSWKQQNRTDNYEPTKDLLLAPATFRLEKGASQVVRIQLNRPLDANEGAYRVFVDEVPAAKEIRPNALKTIVSMAIPVIVAPASGPIAKGQAALKASLAKDVVNIELRNTGKANLKLREWVVSSAKAGDLLKVPSAAYVLAGNTLTGDYPLRIQADGPLTLKVVTDRGTFSGDITR